MEKHETSYSLGSSADRSRSEGCERAGSGYIPLTHFLLASGWAPTLRFCITTYEGIKSCITLLKVTNCSINVIPHISLTGNLTMAHEYRACRSDILLHHTHTHIYICWKKTFGYSIFERNHHSCTLTFRSAIAENNCWNYVSTRSWQSSQSLLVIRQYF